MLHQLKKRLFAWFGKDPEAVVVSFASGDPKRVREMVKEIRELVPGRLHYVVSIDERIDVPGVAAIVLPARDGWLHLRRALRGKRIGLAPVLFDGTPCPLRGIAAAIAPRKILAYNRDLERHHLRLSIASLLFLRGLPLDRIFLRPGWLFPWKKDRTRTPDLVHVREGRPLDSNRPCVAVLSPYFPYPLAHGGAVRIYHLLREAARQFDLFLFAFAKDANALEYAPLLDLCAKVVVVEPPHHREPRWSTLAPPDVGEYDSPAMRRAIEQVLSEVDLLQVEYTQLAQYGGDILVEHDVTWDLYRQLWERDRTFSAWWNYVRWRIYEQRAVRKYRRVVTMSEKDSALLGTGVAIGNGVDLDRFRPEPERPGARLLFVGSFNHFPNVQAFRWFYDEVWHKLSDSARLTVVAGRDHVHYWRQFAGSTELPRDERITMLDFVRDVRPLYVDANLVIVPTTVSAGTNLKVLEAMAMERAVVSTSRGCAGLGLEHGVSVWTADDPPRFASAIERLLADGARRRSIAKAARAIAEAHFDWRKLGEDQARLWREIIPAPTCPPS